MQAFEFMDLDGSGELSRTEIEDAFLGLGIPVTQQVRTGVRRSGSFGSTQFAALHECVLNGAQHCTLASHMPPGKEEDVSPAFHAVMPQAGIVEQMKCLVNSDACLCFL